ncbi:MAG: hypothetical protein QW292_13165 [Candidatus Parvarchaeota archaeon]
MSSLKLSALPKTWILDLDGTIFKHNAYLEDNEDEPVLPYVSDFISKISPSDYIIILTSRDEKFREATINALRKNNIRYNALLMGLPIGERILINDKKESGMKTAFAVNIKRNSGLKSIRINYSDGT